MIIQFQWIQTALFLCSFMGASFLSAQEPAKLHERVDVIASEIPVRVFMKGHPVDGLQVSDFHLFVDDREIPIAGLSVNRKTLSDPTGEDHPRLFVLLFNVVDQQMDFHEALSTCFNSILRSGDRLIVATNRFFLPERQVENPDTEKESILKIISMERKWARRNVQALENKLSLEMTDIRQRLAEGDQDYIIQTLLPRFIASYRRYVEEHLGEGLSLDANQYLRLSKYLQEQDAEKWVISFFQRGSIPLIRRNGNLYRILLQMQRENLSNDSEMKGMNLFDFLQELEVGVQMNEKGDERDIAKAMIQAGAVFHLVLLNPVKAERYLDDFAWKPVTTSTEQVLHEAVTLTGGTEIYDNRFPRFFNSLKNEVDIEYHLLYTPISLERKTGRKIRVVTGNPDHTVLYDDQERELYLRRLDEQISGESLQPKIERVSIEDGLLSFYVRLQRSLPEQKADPHSVNIRLRIINERAETILDRSRPFTIKNGVESVQVRLPELKKGEYDLLIEATETKKGKKDLVIHSFQLGNR